MSKGISAMGFLPQTSIELVHGSADQSIQAVKALLKKVAEMQANDQDAIDTEVVCNGNSPYMNANWEIASKVGASGTITLATSLADDTVTANGLVYTAVTGAKADNTEYSIDGNDTVDAADLADSINNDVRVGTIASGVVATSDAAVVTVTAVATGIGGNAITLAEDTSGTTIVISGALLTGGVEYQCTFQSEVSNLSDDAKGRPALSTRRLIDIDLNVVANPTHVFSVRSVLAVINFIEKLEDKVAETGSGAQGDDTYTNVNLKGATPYETFTWTIVKLANLYTVTPTATS